MPLKQRNSPVLGELAVPLSAEAEAGVVAVELGDEGEEDEEEGLVGEQLLPGKETQRRRLQLPRRP
jgi:hypothetical protein